MRRVGLRQPEKRDAEAVDLWLVEAANAVLGHSIANACGLSGLAGFIEALLPEREVRIASVGGRPVGLLAWSRARSGATAIDFLAIAHGDRNLGFGAEAVLGLEDLYPDRATMAGIPLGNGLAIYFWLRIGYRPLYPQPVPNGLAADRIWMIRPAHGSGGRSAGTVSAQPTVVGTGGC